MKFLHPSFIRILRGLLENNVEFILIGGYAVNYYGFGRPTGDMDIWLNPTIVNKEKSLTAFRALEFQKENIKKIAEQNFTDALVFFHGDVPLRVDFLTRVNLVDFDEAWERKKYWKVENLDVPVVDYEHLILMKITTGRPKDNLDLIELQKINQFKKKN